MRKSQYCAGDRHSHLASRNRQSRLETSRLLNREARCPVCSVPGTGTLQLHGHYLLASLVEHHVVDNCSLFSGRQPRDASLLHFRRRQPAGSAHHHMGLHDPKHFVARSLTFGTSVLPEAVSFYLTHMRFRLHASMPGRGRSCGYRGFSRSLHARRCLPRHRPRSPLAQFSETVNICLA